jgi:hypothetical protein
MLLLVSWRSNCVERDTDPLRLALTLDIIVAAIASLFVVLGVRRLMQR